MPHSTSGPAHQHSHVATSSISVLAVHHMTRLPSSNQHLPHPAVLMSQLAQRCSATTASLEPSAQVAHGLLVALLLHPGHPVLDPVAGARAPLPQVLQPAHRAACTQPCRSPRATHGRPQTPGGGTRVDRTCSCLHASSYLPAAATWAPQAIPPGLANTSPRSQVCTRWAKMSSGSTACWRLQLRAQRLAPRPLRDGLALLAVWGVIRVAAPAAGAGRRVPQQRCAGWLPDASPSCHPVQPGLPSCTQKRRVRRSYDAAQGLSQDVSPAGPAQSLQGT